MVKGPLDTMFFFWLGPTALYKSFAALFLEIFKSMSYKVDA